MSYAAVGPSFRDCDVLHTQTSIFTAEAYALLSAVKYIRNTRLQKAIIYTDSLSVVTTISSLRKHRNPVIQELYTTLCNAYASKQHIIICWVPGHRGIEGNVLADKLATTISKAKHSITGISPTDMKPFLRKQVKMYWQRSWDANTSSKLHLIKPHIANWPLTTKVRRTNIILTRLRIGHTYDTHSYLLNNGDPPICRKCGKSLTILHILLECREVDDERKNHFPLAYSHQIPLHPAMFLGREPLFNHKSVLSFLDTCALHVIRPGDS